MVKLEATRLEDPLPLDDLADTSDASDLLPAWLELRRQRLDELLGPMPALVELNLETIERVECESYTREKVVFDTEATMSVPAYLLIPHDRSTPGPAVLAVHGHGPGKSQAVGLEFTETPGSDYAHQLAQRGYVVLAPDLRCFGERADWNPPDHYGCDTNLVHAVMAGVAPLAQNLWDLARALDVLESHALVDATRIGVAGLSLGGTMSLFLAAWDERVSAAVVSGYFSSWAQSHRMPWNMCGSQVLPGMLGRIEHLDLGALVAPRPLLIESGTSDDLFPVAVASAELQKLRKVYEFLGSAERVDHAEFEGGHRWNGAAYEWFERWLGTDGTAPLVVAGD
jgi:dienelactone hydrolase